MFEVDGWNNFCRIFELPEKYSSEYCFGGGIDTNFKMVDWFNPVGELDRPTVTKEVWKEKVGEFKVVEISLETLKDNLSNFILRKQYVKKGRKYLFLSDFGATFIIDKREKTDV